MEEVALVPMTGELCRRYFREFEADPAILIDPADFRPFVYSDGWADAYFSRQADRGRVHLCVLFRGEPAGELLFKDVDREKRECTLSIHLRNDTCKGKGIGTRAEELALDYAFGQLGMAAVKADTVLHNVRSQHVLEKVGFRYLGQDERFKYYCCEAPGQGNGKREQDPKGWPG